ncbi:hypothetical protein BHM03_00021859 [Ensete ventricosum]|nr:hypothetical protein BHM03_00021859 [Ensete ventricosum]
MVLPSPWHYYPFPCICVPFFAIVPWHLPFSLVLILRVCLLILHLLGLFHDQQLSLHESKGSMIPRKSCLYGTMALPSPWHYYPFPCICVPFFAIGRSASAAL